MIAIWVLLAIYGIGCEIILGFCPLNEHKQDEDTLTKIHGGASAIGFMTLLVVPLILAIMQFQAGNIIIGAISLVSFIVAFAFFCFFIMGEKEKFANTVLRYGGLWQRLVLASCYVLLLLGSFWGLIRESVKVKNRRMKMRTQRRMKEKF